ncbi:nagb/rpia/CoA transferase-like protein [Testicularia cyperi]|uniref:Translation initiation factor eIF2B subunit beta n=1 Tax=Testicularia cyperi TaxID=1882483 RepID=A0A317XT39_9BASI|nr:nagb/rpia/CoA transferase-like protein [Testicularia cyperi]
MTLPATASPGGPHAGMGGAKLSHQAPLDTIVKDRSSLKLINALSLQLRRSQLSGPEKVAEATAKTLRSVVSSARYSNMQELIDIIKAAGRTLQLSQPNEQAIGNVTRRVVHLLREEAKAAIQEAREHAEGHGGDMSGINSLANSISDLRIGASLPVPGHVHTPSAGSSSNSIPQLPSSSAAALSSTATRQSLHSAFSPLAAGMPSSTTSTPASASATPASTSAPGSGFIRPGPNPLRVASGLHSAEGSSASSSSAFVHGSFSISDLVAAGAMATSSSSSMIHTPADGGSYASTPHASLSRKGSGVFDTSLTGISQHIGESSLREDPDAEAEAEAAALDTTASPVESDLDAQEDDDDDDESDDDDDDDDDDDGFGEEDSDKLNKKKGAGAYFLKPLLIQAIQDLIDELETVDDNIAKVSRDHIHSGEVILTLGTSATVESFFKAAAKDRRFTVIVPEAAPSYEGHSLARTLSGAGIDVLLVPDSAVFGVMPRVSKVVMGAHAVLANGGLLASASAYPVALAAKSHSTPVVILTGIYKICPEWSSIQSFTNDSYSNAPNPSDLIDYNSSSNIVQNAEIVSNALDYVPPHLVDVFITNIGEHPPSYVYRLVKENYHELDTVL